MKNIHKKIFILIILVVSITSILVVRKLDFLINEFQCDYDCKSYKIYYLEGLLTSYNYTINQMITDSNYKKNQVEKDIEEQLDVINYEKLTYSFNRYVELALDVIEKSKNGLADKSFEDLKKERENIVSIINEMKTKYTANYLDILKLKKIKNIVIIFFLIFLVLYFMVYLYFKKLKYFSKVISSSLDDVAQDNFKNIFIVDSDFKNLYLKIKSFKKEIINHDNFIKNKVSSLEKDSTTSEAFSYYYLSILNSIDYSLIVVDTFLKINFINDTTSKVFRINADKIINKPFYSFPILGKTKNIIEKLGKVLVESNIIEFNETFENKELKISLVPLMNKKINEIMGIIILVK